jgi:hypothetical protein
MKDAMAAKQFFAKRIAGNSNPVADSLDLRTVAP